MRRFACGLARIARSLRLPALVIALSPGCGGGPDVVDEPKWIAEHHGVEHVPQNDEGKLYPTHPVDVFEGMDRHVESVYGHEFSPDEIKGRNTWVMWTGGNQAFWDHLARHGNGIVDLLKLLDSRFIRRADRFPVMGLIPTPGMEERSPDPDARPPEEEWTRFPFYGLSLDSGIEGESAFARGPVPEPEVYGYPSGIVGLWLFPRERDPDPRVREEWERSKRDWDPVRYLEDPEYYKDPELIRPYRVGMSCGFCHVSVNPMNPPEDMANPRWSELSGTIGSMYFWFGRVFGTDLRRSNLLWYLTNYPEPGTLDTSLLATDGINNPNTMNAVFQLLPRLLVSLQSPMEKQSADTLRYMPRLDEPYDVDGDGRTDGPNDVQALSFSAEERAFLEYLGLPAGDLPPFGEGDMRHTPKILAGGADSIGGRGALCRVYKNIGEFGEQWVRLHNPMVGISRQTPFRMQDAFESSINWMVTMRRSTNLAKYLLASSPPMRLEYAKDLPDGYVKPNDDGEVQRGAEVFARNCFVCHSSLNQPEGFWQDAANWKRWVRQPGYVEQRAAWLKALLTEPIEDGNPRGDPFFEEFVKRNYLSTDARYHVSEIGTNSARSLADNAGSESRMWRDYSSAEFKRQERLPSEIEISHPYRDESLSWTLNTDAGPGRYRPHSLSSMWAHAPYLHNNSVGYYRYEWGDDPRHCPEKDARCRAGEPRRLSWFEPGIQRTDTRLDMFEDAARRLLGLTSEPTEEARRYRRFTEAPRRGSASIVRIERDAAIELPRAVVGDAISQQTEALLGVGIPRWAVMSLLAALLIVGVWVFRRGARRVREGRGGALRNAAALVIGVVLVAGVLVLWTRDEYRIGHIPEGTPANLLLNINGPGWLADSPERRSQSRKALLGLLKADAGKVESLEDVEVRGESLVDLLLDISKCPDLVIDRGHEFGWLDTVELAKGNRVEVPVEDREALIEFLKKL